MCAAGAMTLSACKDEGRPVIDFEVEAPLYDNDEIMSETVDLAGAGSIALRAQAAIDYRVVATAEVVEDELIPDPEGGRIRISGTLTLDPDVEVDTADAFGIGIIDEIEHDFDTDEARFEPFAVGETLELTLAMPQDDPKRRPVADIPLVAVELVLDPAPGSFAVTYQGACLHREGDAVQYTARISIEPDVRYDASIEIAVPFAGTSTFGPVQVAIPLEPLQDQFLDLGTYSVMSRKHMEGVQPCEGMDVTAPEDPTDGGTTTG